MVREGSTSTTNLMGTISVELKLNVQQQQRLQQAAANWGFTIDEGIPTREKIELDANDAQLLNSYLDAPPVANPTLKRLIVEHQEKYGK
jgi:uncharacterized protein (DUF1778 family)